MDSSALCEWPLFRAWTQVKINYPSYHGNTTQCPPRGLPWSKDHTLHHHFTFPPKKRLSVTLLDIVSQADWVWTFIQQAFVTTILCQAPHWWQEDTACPLQELMNYLGKRKRHPKIVRHQGIRQRKSAQPQGTEQRYVTQSRGVRASHMDVDQPWEDKLESVRAGGGQRQRKMRVIPSRERGPHKGAKWEMTGSCQRIPSTVCWNINTHQTVKWKMGKTSTNTKQSTPHNKKSIFMALCGMKNTDS